MTALRMAAVMSPRSTAAPAGARLAVTTGALYARTQRLRSGAHSATFGLNVDTMPFHRGRLFSVFPRKSSRSLIPSGPTRSERHPMPQTAVAGPDTGTTLKELARRHGL